MDLVEYIKLCQNILNFNRNIVITANINSLHKDFQLTSIPAFVSHARQQLQSIDLSTSNVMSDNNSHSNSDPTYWTFNAQKSFTKRWVDIWLFAADYTFSLDDKHAILMMRLVHSLCQNPLWKKAAELRVFLLVNNQWNENDQKTFDRIVNSKKLKFEVDQVVVLKHTKTFQKPLWKRVINGEMTQKHLKKYYGMLNSTMVSLSSETYFTFINLPKL
eukprot:523567_1